MNIQNKDKLLADIADGVKEVSARYPLGSIEVHFHNGQKAFVFTLAYALEALAQDIYWDERGNWSDANRATVHEI